MVGWESQVPDQENGILVDRDTQKSRNATIGNHATVISEEERQDGEGRAVMWQGEPGDQRERCECCGEFLGPEHEAANKRQKVLREMSPEELLKVLREVSSCIKRAIKINAALPAEEAP